MRILRQATSQAVRLGKFVDATDGVTAETGLTIANTDILLSKDGGAFAAKNSGGATHDSAGWYSATFDATDTATCGILEVDISVSGALPVFMPFYVVEEAIYDALFASVATGALPATLVQGGINTTSGTITTLDALDTAQDTQHSTTQSAISTAQGNITDILADTADMQPKFGTIQDLGNGATLASNLGDLAGASFDTTTDSQEAIRNRGDAAWTTGSGGDATQAKQDTIIAALGVVDGIVDDILVDTGTTLPAAIAAIDAGSGSGAYGATVTVTDGTNPLQNATVRVTLNGNTAATGTTDASGNATFSLDAATYTVAITLAGYTFTPTTRTVTAEQTGTLISADLEMSAVSITPSSTGYCTVYVSNVLDEDGDAEAATVYIRATGRGTAADGIALDTKERSVTANGIGYAEFTQCVRLAKYQIRRGSGPWFDITVPDAATYEVPSFYGVDE